MTEEERKRLEWFARPAFQSELSVTIRAALATIDSLQARGDKLAEALKFYAESANWVGDVLIVESEHGDRNRIVGRTPPAAARLDGGKRAREALASWRTPEGEDDDR